MPFLQADTLDPSDFIAIVQRYHSLAEETFKGKPLLLAFSPAHALFHVFTPDELFLKTTDQGRIFSPEGELKWRRKEDRMQVVYLGDEAPPEGLKDYSSKILKLKTHYPEIILWGVRTDTKNEWIEQQVPHRFDYPITTAEYSRGRVVIVIENWMDAFGFAQFSRYHSLKEIPGENNATR